LVALPFESLTTREIYDVLALRDLVFVVGQGVIAEAEADGRDPECTHVIGREEAGRIVATARLFFGVDPAHVGRVAVHPERQGEGLGTELMRFVATLLGDRRAEMSAQAHLIRWYGRLGWRALSDVYDEVGIPHVRMVRP